MPFELRSSTRPMLLDAVLKYNNTTPTTVSSKPLNGKTRFSKRSKRQRSQLPAPTIKTHSLNVPSRQSPTWLALCFSTSTYIGPTNTLRTCGRLLLIMPPGYGTILPRKMVQPQCIRGSRTYTGQPKTLARRRYSQEVVVLQKISIGAGPSCLGVWFHNQVA